LSRILIVDDEQAVLCTLREFFVSFQLDVDCAAGLDEARSMLSQNRYSAVLADVRLSRIGATDGLELGDYIAERCPGTAFVVLTAYGSYAVEREARRKGAKFFLHKPVPLEEIGQIVFGLIAAR
jgi:DNA-binding NtrC family response regulator